MRFMAVAVLAASALGVLAAAGRPAHALAAAALVALAAVPWHRLPAAGAPLATFAAVATISWNGVRPSESVTLSDLFLLLAAGGIGLALLRGRRLPPVPVWIWVGLLLICVSALLADLFPAPEAGGSLFDFSIARATGIADSGDLNFLFAARFVVAIVVAPLIVAYTTTDVDAIGTAWLAGVGVNCLVAVLAAFTPLDLQALLTGETYTTARSAYSLEAARYTGLTVHPNALALATVIAAPLALARISRRPALYAPLTGLFAVAVLLTGSRTALGAFALAVLVVAIVQPQARRPLLAVVAIGAVVGWRYYATLDLSTLDRLQDVGSVSAGISDTERTAVLSQAVELFLQRPLTGHGFEAVRGAHNVMLQLLTAGGILALAGYLALIGGALHAGLRLARTLPGPAAITASACVAAVIVWVAAGMLSNSTIDRWVYVPVALILALQVRTGRPQAEAPPAPVLGRLEPVPLVVPRARVPR